MRSELVGHSEPSHAYSGRAPRKARGSETIARRYHILAAAEIEIEVFNSEQQAEAREGCPFEAAACHPTARHVSERGAGRISREGFIGEGAAADGAGTVLDIGPGGAAGPVCHEVRPNEIAEATTKRQRPFHL